jgi:large subunit ribosomal protein L9
LQEGRPETAAILAAIPSGNPAILSKGYVMEVILREHVEHLGNRGEVVKVADGYARNYLLPRKLALLVTDGNKKQIEREKVKFDVKEAEEKKVAEAMAERIGSVEIEIARKVGETQALYGSVTSADIAEALAAKGFDVDRRKLQLAEPLKQLGEVQVPIKLHRDVTAQVKVTVVAE